MLAHLIKIPQCSASPRALQSLRYIHPTTASLFRRSPDALHGDYEWEDPKSPDDVVRLSIITRNGNRREVAGKVGDNLLYLFHRLRKTNDDLALEVLLDSMSM